MREIGGYLELDQYQLPMLYEGCKRRARYKNGEYVDMLIYAILREEKSI